MAYKGAQRSTVESYFGGDYFVMGFQGLGVRDVVPDCAYTREGFPRSRNEWACTYVPLTNGKDRSESIVRETRLGKLKFLESRGGCQVFPCSPADLHEERLQGRSFLK